MNSPWVKPPLSSHGAAKSVNGERTAHAPVNSAAPRRASLYRHCQSSSKTDTKAKKIRVAVANRATTAPTRRETLPVPLSPVLACLIPGSSMPRTGVSYRFKHVANPGCRGQAFHAGSNTLRISDAEDRRFMPPTSLASTVEKYRLRLRWRRRAPGLLDARNEVAGWLLGMEVVSVLIECVENL
jgi:hypothetical protein